MTAQAAEPGVGPQWHNTFGHFAVHSYYAGAMTVSADPVVVDPHAREIELPRGSALFEHLRRTVGNGGIIFFVQAGQRVLAVVPVDAAEALHEEHSDRDRQADLQELLDEAEARLGPVPPEVAAEVDRQWRAAADRA